MNTFKSTTEIKSEAREVLLGKYGHFISVLLMIELITGVITLTTSLFTSTSVIGQIISIIITLLVELIYVIFAVGLNYFSLNMGLGREYSTSNIFYGFSYKTNKILISQVILFLIYFLCLLPAILLAAIFYLVLPVAPIAAPMFITLAAIIGIFGILYFSLKYQFVFYIILDYPDANIKNIFQFSAMLMEENYFRLFYIYVSFIPYYILAICSLGIGLLFVVPYQKMTITKFYIDLIDCYYRAKEQTEAN